MRAHEDKLKGTSYSWPDEDKLIQAVIMYRVFSD